ncbi:MAG: hypothetical protein KJO65_07055 [Gemmatimonadetes bacterium]|nr:hypothetical protein [Gemmatimonadota bacterium]NNK63692.1 hypothetical protein [Gemmatimonadota bacterium]
MRVTSLRTLALATVLFGAACNEEPLAINDPDEGVTGTWTFIVDVTVANDACEGEEFAPHDTSQVSVVQVGDSVTASGPWGSTSGSETLAGNRSGNIVTISGAYAEDGGTTIATHTLTVSAGDQQMNGAEDWSWIGPNSSSCPAGEAIVTATRNPS